MTHDELMVKINQRYWKMFNHNSLDQTESSIEHRTFIQNQYFALRAVVELHKPDEPDFPDEWESCVECSGNGYVAMYPCQTIKAIEKELE
jgi:hypothetical protein